MTHKAPGMTVAINRVGDNDNYALFYNEGVVHVITDTTVEIVIDKKIVEMTSVQLSFDHN